MPFKHYKKRGGADDDRAPTRVEMLQPFSHLNNLTIVLATYKHEFVATTLLGLPLVEMCNARVALVPRNNVANFSIIPYNKIVDVRGATESRQWIETRQKISALGGLTHGDRIVISDELVFVCILEPVNHRVVLIATDARTGNVLAAERNALVMYTGTIVRYNYERWFDSHIVRVLLEGERQNGSPATLNDGDDGNMIMDQTFKINDEPRLVFEKMVLSDGETLYVPEYSSVTEDIITYYDLQKGHVIYGLSMDSYIVRKLIPEKYASLFNGAIFVYGPDGEGNMALRATKPRDEDDLLNVTLTIAVARAICKDERSMYEWVNSIRGKRVLGLDMDVCEEAFQDVVTQCQALRQGGKNKQKTKSRSGKKTQKAKPKKTAKYKY